MEYDDPDNQPEDLKPEKYLNFEIGLKQQVHQVLTTALPCTDPA